MFFRGGWGDGGFVEYYLLRFVCDVICHHMSLYRLFLLLGFSNDIHNNDVNDVNDEVSDTPPHP